MKILDVNIDNFSLDDLLDKIEIMMSFQKQGYLVTVNPEFLVLAQRFESFKKILNQATFAVADGVGLIFASKVLKEPLKERITGVDLMEVLCQKAAQKKWYVYLLGAKPGIAERAISVLKDRYPNLEIFIWPQRKISSPGILFVALGAPKQEFWINRHLAHWPEIKLAIGVGGAFDFISGHVKRAPVFLQRLGLEWVWRLILQPWRFIRIYKAVIIFPWLFFKKEILK